MRKMSSASHGSAIILGGGIAGLAAALALRPLFERVVILEQDRYPEGEPRARPHTPQGDHGHVLLTRGTAELASLVPELPRWLDELGLREGDLTGDIWTARGDTWLPRRLSDVTIRVITRPILEQLMLRAVRRHDGIEVRTGHRALGLVGRGSITGVRCRDDEGEERSLEAELIVDAAGRRSKATQWLEEAGFGSVERERVDPGVTYTSCLFRPPASVTLPCVLMSSLHELPTDPYLGGILSIHDGLWMVTMITYGRARAPSTVEELKGSFRRKKAPELYEHLASAEALSRPRVFKDTANRRRRFAKLPSWPDRYVVLGDAATTLNPRYGQGITMAALGASALARTLEEALALRGSLDGAASRFQRALDQLTEVPWQTVLMEDRLWAATLHEEPFELIERLGMALTRRLHQTMYEDFDTYVAINRVAHLLDSPLTLLRPRTLAKLAIPTLRRR